MAIKVNGTTVIDDSRNLSNIAGGLKTVNSTSLLGSGNISAGASTTQNDVGTYALAQATTSTSFGSTLSGANLTPCGAHAYFASGTMSGTWRCMGVAEPSGLQNTDVTVWVRIS